MSPVVLIIIDGWGLAAPGPGNAVSQAKIVNIPSFWNDFPHTTLSASGLAVGLPEGAVGNSETGHINLGAGRVIYQDITRINESIKDKSFFSNQAFISALKYTDKFKSAIHILGLVGDSTVHSNLIHLYALLEFLKNNAQSKSVYLHLFTDGRDSPPKSGARLISQIKDRCDALKIGKIATIIGRYYAMDRDYRWERTEKAYRSLTEYIENRDASPQQVIKKSYMKGITDEFIEPVILLDEQGHPYPRIQEHDAVICINYRVDRPRQLTKAFVLADFENHRPVEYFDPLAEKYLHSHIVHPVLKLPFKRKVIFQNLFFVTMTEYERNLSCSVAFSPIQVEKPIGWVFSSHNLRQLRISETEKERFVTYYFNGMREDPFPGEDRLIIPSPKVSTYDLKPEMSAYEIADHACDRISSNIYSFIVINFANTDMVAHSGNISPSIKACETVDICVGKIVRTVLETNGSCIITADHGNVEELISPTGEQDTEHSHNPVPCIIMNGKFYKKAYTLPHGKLADIAPTILFLSHIAIPKYITGINLLADF